MDLIQEPHQNMPIIPDREGNQPYETTDGHEEFPLYDIPLSYEYHMEPNRHRSGPLGDGMQYYDFDHNEHPELQITTQDLENFDNSLRRFVVYRDELVVSPFHNSFIRQNEEPEEKNKRISKNLEVWWELQDERRSFLYLRSKRRPLSKRLPKLYKLYLRIRRIWRIFARFATQNTQRIRLLYMRSRRRHC